MRNLVKQLLEAISLEGEQLGVELRRDIGGAFTGVQERQFAEVIAAAQVSQHARPAIVARHAHLHPPAGQNEHAVAGLAHLAERGARRTVKGMDFRRHPFQLMDLQSLAETASPKSGKRSLESGRRCAVDLTSDTTWHRFDATGRGPDSPGHRPSRLADWESNVDLQVDQMSRLPAALLIQLDSHIDRSPIRRGQRT